ncbi:DUF885 family protein [Streptomyces sp. NPDC087538]|uniref:DUF885 family protein n=1 Tax=Streptomyces sp. NPDC087538 TaxID=3365797 RepID=UPI00381438DF
MSRTPDELRLLAADFWHWRAATAPDSGDDLPRLERPPGWAPDWSAGAVADRRRRMEQWYERHRRLDVADEPVSVQVDFRLLGCALDRVHWELELLRGWQRDPCFYIDQSLVPVYNLLLVSTPFTAERTDAVVRLLHHVPQVLLQARENLADTAAKPFAVAALRKLADADSALTTAMSALVPYLPAAQAAGLPAAAERAATAVREFAGWLREALDGFNAEGAAGRAAVEFLLHRVSLLPYGADRLREQAKQEWTRAVATEAVLRQRLRGHAGTEKQHSAAEQLTLARTQEHEMRRFYRERGLLGQPESLRHYRFAVCPPYLAPLTWLGVPDDLTSPSRAHEDAVRYVPADSDTELPYFERAAAIDPRTAIVHEGVHAQQLALSWAHPNPARRHFYDSVPNEGVAFYNEELMLLSGACDASPTGTEFIANAMRLRSLRVEIDLGLALGELTIDEATGLLCRLVPMDEATAWAEAVFFLGNPGQGLSYQTGKLQLLELLAEAAGRDGFGLKEFHDRLWREGNTPFALQRWELLGLRDQLDAADRLAGATGD